jgi:hypothetical protein
MGLNDLCKGLLRKWWKESKTAPGSPGPRFPAHRADEGNRTPNLLITNQLLYQLSYVSLNGRKKARRYERIKF